MMLSSRSVLDSNHFECHKEVEHDQVRVKGYLALPLSSINVRSWVSSVQ